MPEDFSSFCSYLCFASLFRPPPQSTSTCDLNFGASLCSLTYSNLSVYLLLIPLSAYLIIDFWENGTEVKVGKTVSTGVGSIW